MCNVTPYLQTNIYPGFEGIGVVIFRIQQENGNNEAESVTILYDDKRQLNQHYVTSQKAYVSAALL